MPDDAQDGASAPGVPFAYSIAREEIDKQEAAIREVNSRLGFLLAAALTFGSFYFEKVQEPRLRIGVGVALIVVLILIVVGYVPRTHLRAPNPHGVTESAREQAGRIKELALGAMLVAFDQNARVIAAKNRYYAVALVLGVMAVISGILVETWDGVVQLRTSHEQTSRRSARSESACRRTHCRIPASRGSGSIPRPRTGVRSNESPPASTGPRPR